jgi:diaminopimelate decarboxylase
MNAFPYRGGQLFAEKAPVAGLAERFGTPLYVYSRSHLIAQYRALAAALRAVRPLICYSVKVNTNAAVIHTFARLGAGADVVSGGELFRALRAGVPPSKIVFAGVGKTEEEIAYALRQDILFFTVESEPELRRISRLAARLGERARVAIRVNPDVDPDTHHYISTGRKENKFGLDLARTGAAYELAATLPGIEIAGLHMHIGSQILSAAPYAHALRKVERLCRALRARHRTFRYLDIGGGLGISYHPAQKPLDPRAFGAAVTPLLKRIGLQVVLEPGRFLAGNAGILVARVQYVKHGPAKQFVIVDAGMNDLIRPPLYQAHHEIVAVRRRPGHLRGDVVGPICESADFFAVDRRLPMVREGDLVAIRGAGAYAFAMSSTYNSRGRAAEVMVWRSRSERIRRRETRAELARGERIPKW